MLGRIGDQILDAGNDQVQDDILAEERGESWHLGGSGSLDLGLVVLEEGHESGHELVLCDVVPTSLGQLENYIQGQPTMFKEINGWKKGGERTSTKLSATM